MASCRFCGTQSASTEKTCRTCHHALPEKTASEVPKAIEVPKPFDIPKTVPPPELALAKNSPRTNWKVVVVIVVVVVLGAAAAATWLVKGSSTGAKAVPQAATASTVYQPPVGSPSNSSAQATAQDAQQTAVERPAPASSNDSTQSANQADEATSTSAATEEAGNSEQRSDTPQAAQGRSLNQPQPAPSQAINAVTTPPTASGNSAEIARYLQAGQLALQQGKLAYPADDNAIVWARHAKQLDPSNGAAISLERQAGSMALNQINLSIAAKHYDSAMQQASQLLAYYPGNDRIVTLQQQAYQKQLQEVYQQKVSRQQQQIAAQTVHATLFHRHGSGGTPANPSGCYGVFEALPDGSAKFDCRTTQDSSGRCDHVQFDAGSVKEAKLKKDGSLHLSTLHQGNFDFYGQPADIQKVYDAVSKTSVAAK